MPRKSSGMKINRPTPKPDAIIPDTDEFKEELNSEQVVQVDIFTDLVEQMNLIKGRKNLERFIKANKRDINSLGSSAKHSFLNLVKQNFF